MVKTALHAHEEAERDMVGEDQIITCQAFPVSVTEPSTHQKGCPSPQAQRSTETSENPD